MEKKAIFWDYHAWRRVGSLVLGDNEMVAEVAQILWSYYPVMCGTIHIVLKGGLGK